MHYNQGQHKGSGTPLPLFFIRGEFMATASSGNNAYDNSAITTNIYKYQVFTHNMFDSNIS